MSDDLTRDLTEGAPGAAPQGVSPAAVEAAARAVYDARRARRGLAPMSDDDLRLGGIDRETREEVAAALAAAARAGDDPTAEPVRYPRVWCWDSHDGEVHGPHTHPAPVPSSVDDRRAEVEAWQARAERTIDERTDERDRWRATAEMANYRLRTLTAEHADCPTVWAYEQACKAIEKHRARAEAAEREVADLRAGIGAFGQDLDLYADLEQACIAGAGNPSTLADKVQDIMTARLRALAGSGEQPGEQPCTDCGAIGSHGNCPAPYERLAPVVPDSPDPRTYEHAPAGGAR